MTPESAYLLELAKRNLQPYLALPQVRAALYHRLGGAGPIRSLFRHRHDDLLRRPARR